MEVLDQVGGVDHLSDLVGILEIDRQPLPVVAPGSDDGRVLLPPVLLQEIQLIGSLLDVLGLIDTLEFCHEGSTVFPGEILA